MLAIHISVFGSVVVVFSADLRDQKAEWQAGGEIEIQIEIEIQKRKKKKEKRVL